jgi:hypothetical protein
MAFKKEDMYHGVALAQMVNHPEVESIYTKNQNELRGAYVINKRIPLVLKYARRPIGKSREYLFTYRTDKLAELVDYEVFFGLICVEDQQICCLSRSEFFNLIERRIDTISGQEEQYSIYVKVEERKSLKAYVKSKNGRIGNPILMKRDEFPNKLFA